MDGTLLKGTVECITPVMDCEEGAEADDERMKGPREEGESRHDVKKTVKYFRVTLQEGHAIKAKHVVVATGPTRAQMANIPSWVRSIGESYPEERLQHTVHLMHRLAAAQQTHSGSTGGTKDDGESVFPTKSTPAKLCSSNVFFSTEKKNLMELKLL